LKEIFTIQNPETIREILDAEYGTLALWDGKTPYSVPLNFVYCDEAVYFHGSKRGRKRTIMDTCSTASFSVVEPFSVIPSYFSQDEPLACPASHFFRSVIMEGSITILESRSEKEHALEALMQKYQPEGGYKPFSDDAYTKMLNATEVFKLTPHSMTGKAKLGQHLPKERYEKIVKHLKERGWVRDSETLNQMSSLQ